MFALHTMDPLLLSMALLSIFGIVITGISGLFLRIDVENSKKKVEHLKNWDIDVLFDEREIDNKCDICFGKFDKDAPVVECTCGKSFHMDCVSMTKECPYCKQVPFEMKIRDLRKKFCPACGKELDDKSVCECGTVLPRLDGVFKCVCGKEIHMKDKRCRQCGAEYEVYFLNLPTEKTAHDGKK